MTAASRARWAAAAILGLTLLLPLLGTLVAGRETGRLFEFPPRLQVPTNFPRFSWIAFGLIVTPFVALAWFWAAHRQRGVPRGQDRACAHGGRFPAWGWAALGWMALWWLLAWTRFGWFQPWQRLTFFPLWVGFIVSMNAWLVRRTGTCGMLRSPRRWLGTFAVSAVFWWGFEWLNRFTQNWHYLGVTDYGPWGYALHATLCFSTVLPAVLAVRDLIASADPWQAPCARGPRMGWLTHPATGMFLVGVGIFGLLGAGADPTRFYAALWVAPLALLLGDSILGRRAGLAAEVAAGDWRRIASWAVAALVCGFFWEMWNVGSTPKWIYTVPYADRWHVFEMPLLGYLGYLPFGLECYFVIRRTVGDQPIAATEAPVAHFKG